MNITREFTHPSVFEGIAAGASWADPTMNPEEIDWSARRAAAVIPFDVVNGRPVSPGAPTGIRYGRNELGHWGEQSCADALVTATDLDGRRWLLVVERADGHGWGLPGGYIESGETPLVAAIRELREETGLTLSGVWWILPARLVPDPRASDEAWMVTVVAALHLGVMHACEFPVAVGSDDAKRAAWVRADSLRVLEDSLRWRYQGRLFAAHRGMLRDLLQTPYPQR